jgi:hypothetical protein
MTETTGYQMSVANEILHSTTPNIHSEKTTVTHLGPDQEMIRLDSGSEARVFEMQKTNHAWKIRSYRLE